MTLADAIRAHVAQRPVRHLDVVLEDALLAVVDKCEQIRSESKSHPGGPDQQPSRAAAHRISAALELAGYERRYSDLAGPNADGMFEILAVKA